MLNYKAVVFIFAIVFLFLFLKHILLCIKLSYLFLFCFLSRSHFILFFDVNIKHIYLIKIPINCRAQYFYSMNYLKEKIHQETNEKILKKLLT